MTFDTADQPSLFTDEVQQLRDITTVHDARSQMIEAAGWLSADPFDVTAQRAMHAAMDSVNAAEVLHALQRLRPTKRVARLTSVPVGAVA